MNNDTVAGLITSIRNASKNRERTTQYSATRVTESLSQILYEEGYLEHWLRIPGKKPKISLTLRYKGKDRAPCLTGLRRISKPGLRVYFNHKEIPGVLGGVGIAILSTPQGLMTGKKAREKKIGGEVLCFIW
uniref:ribosomal protein S8 n=1 Tax=Interfilum massjukiae TaxID=519236 RepID=UPI00286CB07E|nr:ribosomal protein S8 [Interfilum massjukiae]WKT06099.1 ribosomal protein S8 [Interfilum massjukiae]WKT06202.1 ribosomal protein S8 [Interfilum sp. SAG 36.88]